MPSESIASFLDLARENRILQPEDMDALFHQPDVPQHNLAALCDFLQKRGILTPYQAGLIRSGQGYELNFAGYPILDELGPCPGGTAYSAMHPSLRTPVVIRRLRTDWFAPSDNASAYLQRAQESAPTTHPHLAHLLDAGVHRDEPFVVLEAFDSADLESLITDIGPMPALLAGEFVRQAASALETAHLRGLIHGEIRPCHLRVGPLVGSSRPKADGSPRYRPGPSAILKLYELGLVPHRPIEGFDPYRAPEAAGPTAEADIFALGGCLAFLLTSKPPTSPALLPAMRPDVPQALLDLASEMLAEEPRARPAASEVLSKLAGILHGTVRVDVPKPPPAESSSILGGESNHLGVQAISEGAAIDYAEAGDVDLASVSGAQKSVPTAPIGSWPAHDAFVPAEVAAPAYTPHEWGAEPSAFEPQSEPSHPMRRSTRMAPKRGINKSKVVLWLGVGLILNVLAVGIWASLFFGVFEKTPEPENKQKPINKKGKAAS